MRAAKRRDTGPELALRSALHRAGLRYYVDRAIPPLSRRRADVVFPRAKVVVFVDGCFWHGCPVHGTWPKNNAAWWQEKILTNQRRDADTDERLRGAGWTVVRFWEHDEPEAAAALVEALVRKQLAEQDATSGSRRAPR